jgi:hypothetical protein
MKNKEQREEQTLLNEYNSVNSATDERNVDD